MLKYPIVFLFIAAFSLNAYSQKTGLSELDSYLKKSVTWESSTLNKKVPLKIYFQRDRTENPDGAEIIVYLKNKA